MNILLITDEVWNDEVHGNNVLTNWFEGFPANFSNIYYLPFDKIYVIIVKLLQNPTEFFPPG